tara:strand:- start:106 stop:246 length:141 start_codon:yes stop_codon:yes gene_type:complete
MNRTNFSSLISKGGNKMDHAKKKMKMKKKPMTKKKKVMKKKKGYGK